MLGYPDVLVVDSAGNPKNWENVETAIAYFARDKVAWSTGQSIKVFHGGVNRASGERSIVDVPSIIATTGPVFELDKFQVQPALNRETLFARDQHLCAYCGEQFRSGDLTKEHIHPQAKGGADTWENVVSACKPCNSRKSDFTLDEIGMELLYVPYAPNFFETMILKNRRILADQMEFLIGKVPQHSRLHDS